MSLVKKIGAYKFRFYRRGEVTEPLFEGGKSIERERSLQRWLLSRQAHLEARLATD